MNIKEVKSRVGEEVRLSLLLEEMTSSISRFNITWLDAIGIDKSGEIPMKIWSENIKPDFINYQGRVVEVLARVTSYRQVTYLEVVDMQDKGEDVRDYIPALSKEEIDYLVNTLNDYIDIVKEYKDLLKQVFTANNITKLAATPLSVHRKLGGMLQRLVSVTELAEKMADVYNEPSLDYDLVITGALLYDIAGMFSYKGCQHSTRRMLVSDSIDTALYINGINQKLGKQKLTDLSKLMHIITVGKNSPKTIEALIVFQAVQTYENILMFKQAADNNNKSDNSLEIVGKYII